MIGVVGPGSGAEDLLESLDDLLASLDGVERVTGDAENVLAADPEVVIAVGEPAVGELVAAGVEAPLLPVEAGPGLDSVTRERAPAVVEAGLDSGFRTTERPVVGASVDGADHGRGVFDAMLVTTEPARISEFAVETASWTERFRADGVVVSTPAGSHGYSRAAGGPLLDAGAASLAVVPVAAFATRPTVRVADADATLAVSVERDEGAVSLLVDGHERSRVPPDRTVTVRVEGTVETVVDPES